MNPIPRTYCNWDAIHRAIQAVDGIPLLPAGAVAILVVIARHINADTDIAYASYDTFLAEAHVAPRTSSRALNALVKAGLIVRISGGFPNRSNQYRLGESVPEFVATEKVERSTHPKSSQSQSQ